MRRRSRQGRGSVRQNGPVRSRHLFALLALAFALGVPGAVQAQVRVMPLGDSITEAETGFASYRYWLWHELVDAGYDIDLVGSMNGVWNGPPFYPDFDQDHEGHWGWRADEVLGQLAGWTAAAQPDLVLLHLGHNDLWQGQGVADAIGDLSAIIGVLRAANPAITILFAQVIPSTVAGLWEIPALNAEIAILAAALTTPDSPVIVVDHWTGFDPNTQTYDGVHPNQAGEQMMSGRWFTALGAVLGPSGLIFRDGFETGDTDAWSAILPG